MSNAFSGYEDDAAESLGIGHNSGDVERLNDGGITGAAKEKLKQLVAKVERINEEIKEVQDQRKDVFAEAKSMGYDVKALRTVIRERGQDKQQREEQEAINDVYRLALDMND